MVAQAEEGGSLAALMRLYGAGFTSPSVPAADLFGAAERLCESLGQSQSKLMGRIPHSELDGMHEPAESPGRFFCCAHATCSPSEDVSRPFSFNLDGGDKLDNLLLTGLHDGPHFADDYAVSICDTLADSDGNLRLTTLSLGSQSLPRTVFPKAKRERYQGFEFLSRKCPRSSSPTLQWSPLASPTHFYAREALQNGYDINCCEIGKGFDIDFGRSRPLSSASSATTIVSAPHNASAFSPVAPRTETCQSQHLVANSGNGAKEGMHMQFRSVAICTRSCACFDADDQCADPEFVRTALKELQMCAVDMFDEDLDGCPRHVWTQFGHYFNA